MRCEKCGSDIPKGIRFCPACGHKVGFGVAEEAREKSMAVALAISVFLMGLGIAYAGNRKNGIIFFVSGVAFTVFGRAIPVFAVVGILIWAFGLYETYNEVRIANGVSNPSIFRDIRGFPTPKKAASIIAIVLVCLLVIGVSVAALLPAYHVNSVDEETLDDVDLEDLFSGGSSDDDAVTTQSSSEDYDIETTYDVDGGSSLSDSAQNGQDDSDGYEIESFIDEDGGSSVEVDGNAIYVDG